jgi:hypothetical protein
MIPPFFSAVATMAALAHPKEFWSAPKVAQHGWLR